VLRCPPTPTLPPYTTLFRSRRADRAPARPSPGARSAHRERWLFHDIADRLGGESGRLRLAYATPLRHYGPRALRVACCTTQWDRSEEHMSELQSRCDLVCRL